MLTGSTLAAFLAGMYPAKKVMKSPIKMPLKNTQGSKRIGKYPMSPPM
jgi:hypothetical protein